MHERWLVYSKLAMPQLLELRTEKQFEQSRKYGYMDVTDKPEYENLFKEQTEMATRRTIKHEEEAPSVEVAEQPFHEKYRPKTLKEMYGQQTTLKSLETVVKARNHGHTYLFTGPAGTGKTTLARILAAEFNCNPANIIEVDAASNSGVDAMRDVMSVIKYQGFGEAPNRMIIIDECHALSKQAWQSLLKPLEEPPPHVYFALCTTETGKIPETIATRAHSYNLKALKHADLMDLLEFVADTEKLDTPDEVLDAVAKASNGSARRALVMLSQCRDCKDRDDAYATLETVAEDNAEAIELARLLLDRKAQWSDAVKLIKALPENPESTRIVVMNYLAAVAMNAKSESEAARILDIMYEFRNPFNATDKNAPLLLAVGAVLLKD